MVSIVECNEICSVWTRMVKLSFSLFSSAIGQCFSLMTRYSHLRAFKRLYIKIRIQCTMCGMLIHMDDWVEMVLFACVKDSLLLLLSRNEWGKKCSPWLLLLRPGSYINSQTYEAMIICPRPI